MSRLRTSIFLIGGVVAVALAAGLSLFFGSTPIPPDQVLEALFSPDMANQEHVAILELRGPRTVGCILVGAAFAVAGAIMQGVTRNPLADSGLLGINAGAAFALALCLALLPGMSFAGVVGCSFVGATFALAVVFGAVSFRRRNVDPVLLVLAGCAVGLFLTALAQGVAIFFNIGYSLTFWTAGGVAGIRADTLAMLRTHPEINVLIALSETTAVGAAQAVQQMQRADDLWLAAFDSNIETIDALQTGTVDTLIVQNTYGMGYFGVESAYKLLAGQGSSVEKSNITATRTITRENMFAMDKQKALFPFG